MRASARAHPDGVRRSEYLARLRKNFDRMYQVVRPTEGVGSDVTARRGPGRATGGPLG
jgi:hypothetical protein